MVLVRLSFSNFHQNSGLWFILSVAFIFRPFVLVAGACETLEFVVPIVKFACMIPAEDALRFLRTTPRFDILIIDDFRNGQVAAGDGCVRRRTLPFRSCSLRVPFVAPLGL